MKERKLPSYQIVSAEPEDAGDLTELAFKSKAFWGYPPRWLEIWREYLIITDESLRTSHVFKAVAESKEILGFYRLSPEKAGLHLTGFWVTPNYIRLGLGRALYKHMIEQAKKLKASSVHWECDFFAAPFYEKMGAEYDGAKTYVMDGREWTVPLMRAKIEHLKL